MVPKPGPVLEGVVLVKTILKEEIVQEEKWMQTIFVLLSQCTCHLPIVASNL